MSSDYDILLARLAHRLHDPDFIAWAMEELQEALRLALATYNRKTGLDCVLGGLDGAATSSLPGRDFDLLLIGASGLAAATLSLERISQFAPDDRISIDLLRWAKDQLLAFDKGLEDVRRRGFHSSSQSPHMPWYWEE